jgi:hypothetical protein
LKRQIPFEAIDSYMNVYEKLLDTLEQVGSAKVKIDYNKTMVTIEPEPTFEIRGEGAIKIRRQPRLIEITFFGKYYAYVVTKLIKAFVLSEKIGLMTTFLELIDATENEIYSTF